MIQRIQSLYLLLVATLGAVLFFIGEYLTLTFSVLTIIISLLSLVIIFLYSKRKIQMTLTKVLIALIVIFIGATCYYSFSIMSGYNAPFASIYGLQLLLAILAYLGIKKDDNLVKSYDRLR